MENIDIEKRIKLLSEFKSVLLQWLRKDSEDRGNLRTHLNKNIYAVQYAIENVGAMKSISISPPPAIGGMMIQNANPFNLMFKRIHGQSSFPVILDMLEQAIGIYEHLRNNTGLIRLELNTELDIESSIERALRPFFKQAPPQKEKQVQDAIEFILNSLGIDFTREQETAPVGSKSFIPDFIIPDLDLCIEVKLAKENHNEKKIQEELNADISA
ncbi:MAG: hypothetical protein IIA49_15770 [Bacteroidetes bacterium]|nr:hypothetical protein [Bacteroidota bacterium]